MAINKHTTAYATEAQGAGAAATYLCTNTTLIGIGAQFFGRITNGATGPTIALTAQPQISPNGTDWFNYGAFATGSTGNAAVTTFSDVRIPTGVKYFRCAVFGNTDNDVQFYGVVQDYRMGSGRERE